jgi:hypothetical protein
MAAGIWVPPSDWLGGAVVGRLLGRPPVRWVREAVTISLRIQMNDSRYKEIRVLADQLC